MLLNHVIAKPSRLTIDNHLTSETQHLINPIELAGLPGHICMENNHIPNFSNSDSYGLYHM